MVQLRLHVLAAVFLAAILTTAKAAPMTESLLASALMQNEASSDNSQDLIVEDEIGRNMLDKKARVMDDEDTPLLYLYLQQALAQSSGQAQEQGAQLNWRRLDNGALHKGAQTAARLQAADRAYTQFLGRLIGHLIGK